MIVLTALLLTGCAPQEEWDARFGDPYSAWNDEDGVYQGPTRVDRVYLDCDTEQAVWYQGVYTVGWASGVEITTHQSYAVHQETHALESVDRGDRAQWEHLTLELPIVAAGTEVAGETTSFRCDYDFLTWRVEVRDLEGERSDCAVFGYDPGVFVGGDCRLLELLVE